MKTKPKSSFKIQKKEKKTQQISFVWLSKFLLNHLTKNLTFRYETLNLLKKTRHQILSPVEILKNMFDFIDLTFYLCQE